MRIEGDGEPLVLFHGILCSERVWGDVVPMLAEHYKVIAPTALGHRGGNPARPGIRFSDVVDDAEATLDKLGIEQAHLAGNSLGGWMALELARRGRAKSVCALSPAGCWDIGVNSGHNAGDTLQSVVRLTKMTRWGLPLFSRIPAVRRFAMQDNAVHGERLRPKQLVMMADDLLGCEAADDLFATNEQLEPLDPTPCPITLAWAEKDRIFPPRIYEKRARELMPGARWRILPKVGHVPMLDDPGLVVETIRECAGARGR